MNQTEEAEAMAVDFSDKRFRSDFEAEKKRILAAIKDCEAMDKELTTTCGELKQSMSRARGAASLEALAAVQEEVGECGVGGVRLV